MAQLAEAHTLPSVNDGRDDVVGNVEHKSLLSATHKDAFPEKESKAASSTLSSQKCDGRATVSVLKYIQLWWLEIFSCLASVFAVIAIFVTANAYDNKPNPHWPQGLSINTLISIYVVILKAALLTILTTGLNHLKWSWFSKIRPLNDLATYDGASRGPHGALWLLVTVHGRDVLPTIAAFVTIAAVVLDPIAQELIQYYSCSRAQPAVGQSTTSLSASVQRTASYSEAVEDDISYGLKMAINAGLYSQGSTVNFQCSSGYCTFPEEFYTIGYTHSCEDITTELRCTSTQRQQNISILATDPQTQLPYDSWEMINVTDFQMGLPSGMKAKYSYSNSEAYYQDQWVMAYNSDVAAVDLLMLNVEYVVEPPSCNESTTGNWTSRGFGAARCTLKPAVLAVSASVQDGRLHETVALATDSFGEVPATGPVSCPATSTIHLPCLTPAQMENLTQAGYDVPAGAEWFPIHDSWICERYRVYTPGKTTIVPQKCMYTYGYSLDSFFSTFFTPGSVSWHTDDTDTMVRNTSTVSEVFYNSGRATFHSVDGIFANISKSMTTYIRGHGDDGYSTLASGNVVTTLTCIRVRWGLIAYPAALAAVTIAFFVALAVQDRMPSRNVPGLDHDLKGNPLALLFYGFDDRTASRVEALSGRAGTIKLVKEVENMPVSVRLTDRGWRFVSEEDKGVA
ncbi:hypothetical protein A1O7_05550 [Cladophialophora yegresii CBS 114405]|uniref:Uncharacterized protein n=1 Tax=Cladophialophora yegresii CBS 114405 TaxID=1182544 RepID=W9W0U1_9EURO|nr:uncharacterized protein A1O7_05550 [Cladophialophora yegresii CBS 114405]EXJ58126.1 hypothetical protein A1O7_05550 [Cladophialophora yegresii CBS 114405]